MEQKLYFDTEHRLNKAIAFVERTKYKYITKNDKNNDNPYVSIIKIEIYNNDTINTGITNKHKELDLHDHLFTRHYK